MPNNDLQLLYKAASQKFNVGSYESFKTNMGDTTKRKAFYNAAVKKFNLGPYEHFTSKVDSALNGQQNGQVQKVEEAVSPEKLTTTQKEPPAIKDSDIPDFGLSTYLKTIKDKPSPTLKKASVATLNDTNAPPDSRALDLPDFTQLTPERQQEGVARSMKFPDAVPIDPSVIESLSPEKQAELQQKALEENPAYHLGYINTKTIFDDAIDKLKVNPKDTQAFNNLGYVYYQSGNYDKAQQAYVSTIAVDPENTDALLGLGNIQSTKGNHAAALEYYDDASKTFAKNGVVDTRTLASIAAELHRGDKNDLALKYVNKALQTDPRSQELYAMKFTIDEALGDTDAMKQDAYNFKVTAPTMLPQSPSIYADNLAATALTEKAMKDLGNQIRGIFTGNPRSPFAFMNPMSIVQGAVRGGYHLGKHTTEIIDAVTPDYGGYQKGVDKSQLASGIVGSMQSLTDIGFSALSAVNPELYAFNQAMSLSGTLAPNENKAIFSPLTTYFENHVYNSADKPMPDWLKSTVGMSELLGNLLVFHMVNSASAKEKLTYQQIAQKFLEEKPLTKDEVVEVNTMLRGHINSYMPAIAEVMNTMPDFWSAENKLKVLPIALEMHALAKKMTVLDQHISADRLGLFKDFYQEELGKLVKRDKELKDMMREITTEVGPKLGAGAELTEEQRKLLAANKGVSDMMPGLGGEQEMASAIIDPIEEVVMNHIDNTEPEMLITQLKKDLGIEETTPTVAPETATTSLTTEGKKEFIQHAGNEYEVTKDKEGALQFENSASGQPITRKSEHYDTVVSKYIVEKFGGAPLTKSKATDTEGYAHDVAATSENPLEILMTAIHVDELEGGGKMSAKDQHIHDHGVSFNADDLKREFGMSLSNLGNWEAIRKNYYSPTGKSIDQSLVDMQSDESGSYSLTHEDLWNYIQKYPYGHDVNTSFGDLTKQLADRFESVTGAPFDRQMMDAFSKTYEASKRIPEADADVVVDFINKNPQGTVQELFGSEEGKAISPESKTIIEDESKINPEDDPWAESVGQESKPAAGKESVSPPATEKKQPAKEGGTGTGGEVKFNVANGETISGHKVEVPGIEHLDLAVGRVGNSNDWKVIEIATGGVIGDGLTEAEAISNTEAKADTHKKVTYEKIHAKIEQGKYGKGAKKVNESDKYNQFLQDQKKQRSESPFLYSDAERYRLEKIANLYKKAGDVSGEKFTREQMDRREGEGRKADLSFLESGATGSRSPESIQIPAEDATASKLSIAERKKRSLAKAENAFEKRKKEILADQSEIFKQDRIDELKRNYDERVLTLTERYDKMAGEKQPEPGLKKKPIVNPYPEKSKEFKIWHNITEAARDRSKRDFIASLSDVRGKFPDIVTKALESFGAKNEGELYDAIRERQLGQEIFKEERPKEQSLESIATKQGWENWLDLSVDSIKKWLSDNVDLYNKPEYAAFKDFLTRLLKEKSDITKSRSAVIPKKTEPVSQKGNVQLMTGKLKWSTAAEWASVYHEIQRRDPSSDKYKREHEHLEKLASIFGQHVIDTEDNADVLREMQRIVNKEKDAIPKGDRANHPTVTITDAINRRLTQLEPAGSPFPETIKQGKAKLIGTNTEGLPIYEDERKVRMILKGNIIRTEPVGIIPGGGISTRTPDEYKTKEELAPPAAEKQKSGLDEAWDEFKGIWDEISDEAQNPGIINDPLRKAEQDLKLLSAAMKLLRAAIKEGLYKFADIVNYIKEKIGDKIDILLPTLKKAYASLHTDAELSDAEIDKLDDVKNVRNFEITKADERQSTSRDTTVPDAGGADISKSSGNKQPQLFDRPVSDTAIEKGDRGKSKSSVGGKKSTDRNGAVKPGGGGGDKLDNPVTDGSTGKESDADSERTDGGDTKLPRSVIAPADRNFVITPETSIVPVGGEISKIKANIAAIKLLRELQNDGRNPTPEEKEILAQFTGWGGLSSVLSVDKAGSSLASSWKAKYGVYHDTIKKLLTQDEFNDAVNSTTNAHYTQRDIIGVMWEAAKQFGFSGGKILEPSSGIGHLIGMMPPDLLSKTSVTMVELDSITGGIAERLYPQHNVQVTGFQDAKVRPASYDMVIANVPFAAAAPFDKTYSDLTKFSMHDYFIAKSMRMVRPGGIGIIITSSSTMDKPGVKFRQFMDQKESVDLIGAIRLPNSAFATNAGTEVTTDMIFVRKRSETGRPSPYAHRWHTVENLREATTKEGKPTQIAINEYYLAHPEMMLGQMHLAHEVGTGGLYGPNVQTLAAPKDSTPAKMVDMLREKMNSLPSNIVGNEPVLVESPESQFAKDTDVDGTFSIDKDKVYFIENGERSEVDFGSEKIALGKGKTATAATIIRDFVTIKGFVKDLMAAERSVESTDEMIEAKRSKLRNAYSTFIDRYGGKITGNRNISFLEQDSESSMVYGLEEMKTDFIKTSNGQIRANVKVARARILTERVHFPYIIPDKADNVSDATDLSMIYHGTIDVDYISSLLSVSYDNARKQILEAGLAFEDPENGMLASKEEYLSGNVREKLRIAEEASKEDQRFAPNVTALNAAQPPYIPMRLITPTLGASWIPTNVYERFASEVLESDVKVVFNPLLRKNNYEISNKGKQKSEKAYTVWGIHGLGGVEFMNVAMNNKELVIYDPDPEDSKKRIRNPQKMDEALNKLEDLKAEFNAWIKRTEDIHGVLEDIFNTKVNNYTEYHSTRTLDRFPGQSETIDGKPYTMRAHQSNGVFRSTRMSTLLAWQVGTGKTDTLITIAMEMRRLKTGRKPMIAVWNETLEQFASRARKLYPGARILAPTRASDMDAKNRQRLIASIAYGDWDIIIIPHSFLKFIPNDPQREIEFINERISELTDIKGGLQGGQRKDAEKEIEKAKDRITELKTRKVKDLAKQQLGIEKRTKKQLSARRDQTFYFEHLGVDALLLDEADAFKKIGFESSRRNVRGVDTAGSQRALDAYLKARYIMEINNGRNFIHATGTPISNTMAEIWTMMRYSAPEVLENLGIQNFDSFAMNFGNIETSIEMTAAGTVKEISRFKTFNNVPALVSAFRNHCDVVLSTDVAEFKQDNTLPKLRTGKAIPKIVEMSPALKDVMDDIKGVYLWWESLEGKEKRQLRHIPLVLYGQAKKAAVDIRLLNDKSNNIRYPDDPGSKLNSIVNEALQIYKDNSDMNGVQLIFCDSINSPDKTFNSHQEIKRKLMAGGVPEDEIVIANNKWKGSRRALSMQDANEGKVRFMIGHTDRLGVGVNVQMRVVAWHHADAPPRPRDYDQRNGRGLRQGNLCAIPVSMGGFDREVGMYNWGVKNTLDALAYDRLAIKSFFTNQVITGKVDWGAIEDPADEVGPSDLEHGAMMGLLSGSKTLLLLNEARRKIRKLESAENNFELKLKNLATRKRELERLIPYNIQERKPQLEDAVKDIGPWITDGKISRFKINGVEFTEGVGKEIENAVSLAAEEARKRGVDFNHAVTTNIRFGETLSATVSSYMFMIKDRFDALNYNAAIGTRIVQQTIQFNDPITNAYRWTIEYKAANSIFSPIYSIVEDIFSAEKQIDSTITHQQKELEGVISDLKEPFKQRGELAEAKGQEVELLNAQKAESATAPVIELTGQGQKLVDGMKQMLVEAQKKADDQKEEKPPSDDDEEDDEEIGVDDEIPPDDVPPSGGGSGKSSGGDDREYRWQQKINDWERRANEGFGSLRSDPFLGLPKLIMKAGFAIMRATVKAGFSLDRGIKNAVNYIKSTEWYRERERKGDKYDENIFKQVLQSYGFEKATEDTIDHYLNRLKKYVTKAPDAEMENIVQNLTNMITQRVKEIGDSDTRLFLDALREINQSGGDQTRLATAIKNFEKDLEAYHYRHLYREATRMKKVARRNLGSLQKFPDIRVIAMELVNMPIVKNRKRVPPDLLFNFVRAIEPLTGRGKELIPNLTDIINSLGEMRDWANSIETPEPTEREASALSEEKKRQEIEQYHQVIDEFKENFDPTSITRAPEIDGRLQQRIKEFVAIDHTTLDLPILRKYAGIMANLAANQLFSPNLYNDFVLPARQHTIATSATDVARDATEYFDQINKIKDQLLNNPKSLWDSNLLKDGSRLSKPFWDNFIQRLTRPIEQFRLDYGGVERALEQLYKALGTDMKSRGKSVARVRMYAVASQVDVNRPDVDFRERLEQSLNNMKQSAEYSDLYHDYLDAYHSLKFDAAPGQTNTVTPEKGLINLQQTWDSFTPAEKKFYTETQKLYSERLQPIVQDQQMYVRGENVNFVKNYEPMPVLGSVNAMVKDATTEEMLDSIVDGRRLGDNKITTKAGASFSRTYPKGTFYSFSYPALLSSIEGVLFDKYLTEPVREVFGAMMTKPFLAAFNSDVAKNLRTHLMTMLKNEIGFNEQAKSINQRLIDALTKSVVRTALVSVKRLAEYPSNWINAMGYISDNPMDAVNQVVSSSREFFDHPQEWINFLNKWGFSAGVRFSSHVEMSSGPTGTAMLLNPFFHPIDYFRASKTVRKKFDTRNRSKIEKMKGDLLHSLTNNNMALLGNAIGQVSIGFGDMPSTYPIWLASFRKMADEMGAGGVVEQLPSGTVTRYPEKLMDRIGNMTEEEIIRAGNYAELIVDKSVGASNRGRGAEKTYSFKSEDERRRWFSYALGQWTYLLGRLMYQQMAFFWHNVDILIRNNGEYGRARAATVLGSLIASNMFFNLMSKVIGAATMSFGDPKERDKQLQQLLTGEYWARNAASSLMQLMFLGNKAYFTKMMLSAMVEFTNKKFTESVLNHPYNAYQDALLYSPRVPLPTEWVPAKNIYNTFMPFVTPIENAYQPFLDAWDINANGNPDDDQLLKFKLIKGALALMNLQMNIPIVNKEVLNILNYEGMGVKPSEYDDQRQVQKDKDDQHAEAKAMFKNFADVPKEDAVHSIDSLLHEATTGREAEVLHKLKHMVAAPKVDKMTDHDKFIYKMPAAVKEVKITKELESATSEQVLSRLKNYHTLGVIGEQSYVKLMDDLYYSQNLDKLTPAERREYNYRQKVKKSK